MHLETFGSAEYPFKKYPYTDKSTLYICHGCKRTISTRKHRVYFRKFVEAHKDANIGLKYYTVPLCEKCNKNPDSWWNY